MVWINLENVGVEFPIYGGTSRSLKNSLLRAGSGARVARDAGDRAVVKALRGISLELREGDRFGLIGGNGAGKTTLLRTMSGIYEPTRGSITTQGTIVPLFGGNLGMDQELPGYDNIDIRGRILGLSRKEILARIDDIAEFTELGNFLHLPVRTYSAGMRVRLAFAITTAVDADILLLDEGLGAGDSSFRKKAQARLNKFIARAGILVVASHSESLMRRFCDRGLWLDHGEVKAIGPLEDVLAAYREANQKPRDAEAEAEAAEARRRRRIRARRRAAAALKSVEW